MAVIYFTFIVEIGTVVDSQVGQDMPVYLCCHSGWCPYLIAGFHLFLFTTLYDEIV